MKRYEELDHTADLRIVFYGRSIGELFRNAGLGLFELMVTPLDEGPAHMEEIRIEGDDLEDLIVNWLRELHGRFVVDGEVVTGVEDCHVVGGRTIAARIEVVPFDSAIHRHLREIKAVTYHGVRVGEEGGRWAARIVFDV
ncbi:archease [Thermodesulfobacteriota bacterium]